jgi:hypothetical protein
LRALYKWPVFAPFVRDALEEENFFPYADPLSDVIIYMVDQGERLSWHFDTNNFTITLAIQNGEHGGAFEYCPWLHSSEKESYAGIQSVMDGDRAPVCTLNIEPGDLQILTGRYALHRGTPVHGQRACYVEIFSYVEEPGMVGSLERTRQLYDRVLPIHEERADFRANTLIG